MTVAIVVGAQWGDEGKGKVVDLLGEEATMVVRYGGGANAGHTLVIDGKELVTHLIPSGVMHKGTRCVLGAGMVIDPKTLVKEIEQCQSMGLLQSDELVVGAGAHLVMPYHRLIEGAREESQERKGRSIGTTLRGIGPAYESKCARRGVRVADLFDRGRVQSLIEQNMVEIAPLLTHYGQTVPSGAEQAAWVDEAMAAGDKFARWVKDSGLVVSAAIEAGENVLFEGAQGALLDIDHGTYPYVTSSATLAGGAAQGLGIGPTHVGTVVGITKAYCTRVGKGPFPTEMQGAEENEWREAGGEFGATTGRPRRCGWLDVASLRRVARLNGLSALALTKLDILSGRGDIKICVGYRRDQEESSELPAMYDDAWIPEYEVLPGWSEDISGARSLDDLPQAARDYVSTVEKLVGVPISLVSVGPERHQTITLGRHF